MPSEHHAFSSIIQSTLIIHKIICNIGYFLEMAKGFGVIFLYLPWFGTFVRYLCFVTKYLV